MDACEAPAGWEATRNGYANHGCRCAGCKRASSEYERARDTRPERRAARKRTHSTPAARANRARRRLEADYKEAKNARRMTPEGRRRDAARQSRRRARSRAVVVVPFTDAEWRSHLELFGGVCAYCGRGGQLERDHVVPLALGGPDRIENLVPACRACNASKGALPMLIWMQRKAAA